METEKELEQGAVAEALVELVQRLSQECFGPSGSVQSLRLSVK